MTISRIHARQVLDSRGNPTVEVEVHLAEGATGRAIVPSGASTGKHEARELRDNDPTRYGGKSVLQAVANVRDVIAPTLIGADPRDQEWIDQHLCKLDGTPDKSRLGANAILGVSLAVAHAAAAVEGLPLWRWLGQGREPSMPMPMVNMISGGLHAGGNLDIQDVLLVPIGATTYSQALEIIVAVYRRLGKLLTGQGYEGVLVGDEGGFGPRLSSNESALALVTQAMHESGQQAGIALDIASTHFFDEQKQTYKLGSRQQMVDMLATWCDRYPIISIEDGCAEDDWEGWKLLTDKLGSRVQLIGDDLFVTNSERLKLGIARGAGNSILIKVNQIGTLTETLRVMDEARAAGYRPVVSARSGETEDATIADLAVGSGAGQIKIGSIARSERLAKYNQLLRIEEVLPGPESFAGWQPLR